MVYTDFTGRTEIENFFQLILNSPQLLAYLNPYKLLGLSLHFVQNIYSESMLSMNSNRSNVDSIYAAFINIFKFDSIKYCISN